MGLSVKDSFVNANPVLLEEDANGAEMNVILTLVKTVGNASWESLIPVSILKHL